MNEEQHFPNPMTKPNYECRILAINPYRQTENDGDEIFLKLNKKRIWPKDVNFVEVKGQESVKVNYPIQMGKLDSKIELELWEYDNILFSECIGKFSLLVDEIGGPYHTDMETLESKAKYTLIWEVVLVSQKRLVKK
jgi:hypothetical protein